MRTTTTLAAALLCAASGSALAQTPPQSAFAERAQVVPTGKRIHIYRLPSTNSAGAVRYHDVTIDLAIDSTGKPEATAVVESVRSPSVSTGTFVPGTYTGQGWTCNLTRGILPTGRAEGAITCNSPNNAFTASWVNGQIDGHPFELDLRASKIDTIPGHAQFAWGKVGNTVFNRVYHGCITTNVVVSARQVGDQVSINGYRSDGTARCGITLTRNP